MSKNAYPTHERISLAHGNGGRLMRELIDGLFARSSADHFDTRVDAARLPLATANSDWMITTDGFTVELLEFPRRRYRQPRRPRHGE